MRVLLVTPPMIQLNTPYPATAYLTGFLRQQARERGLGAGRAAGRPGAGAVPAAVQPGGAGRGGRQLQAGAAGAPGKRRGRRSMAPRGRPLPAHAGRYQDTVEAVVRFLQGRDPGLAMRIAGRQFLPEGPRFAALSARRIRTTTDAPEADAGVGVRPAGSGRSGQAPGQPVHRRPGRHVSRRHRPALRAEPLRREAGRERHLVRRPGRRAGGAPHAGRPHPGRHHRPAAGGSTARTCWGSACRSPATSTARSGSPAAAASSRPATRIVLGGGYVNTELRDLADPRVFDDFDYVTLDDGERPLLALIEHLQAPADPDRTLLRTLVRTGQGPQARIELRSDPRHHDVPLRDAGTPTYDGLPLGSLRLAVRDAEPDVPAVVRRPLEQADRGPRLLLEEVHVLRRHARLHRPLRSGVGRSCWSIASRR